MRVLTEVGRGEAGMVEVKHTTFVDERKGEPSLVQYEMSLGGAVFLT